MNQVQVVEIEREHEPIRLVETDMATRIIEYGRENDCTFKPLPYRGLLVEPFTDDEWHYEEYVDQPLTDEAMRRLFMVGTMPGVRIDQIIYAKELTEPAPKVDPWKVAVAGAGIIAAVAAAAAAIVVQAILSDPALIISVDGKWIQLHSWV